MQVQNRYSRSAGVSTKRCRDTGASVHTNTNNPYGVQLRDKLRNSGFGLILGTILVAVSFTV